jgi:hypothetical protein
MSNILISNLPTYTGDTTGSFLVINDSGNTTTYKTTRENLIGDWIDAGTINGVGWSATTTAPTVATIINENNIKYRNIGGKNWEVYLTYSPISGGSNGSGDYLFTLPGGLLIDNTIQGQALYQIRVGEDSPAFGIWALTSSGLITNGTVMGQTYAVPYLQNIFRIFTPTYGTGNRCWGSGFYGMLSPMHMSFTFTST